MPGRRKNLTNCWFHVFDIHCWGRGFIITYIMFTSHYWGKIFTLTTLAHTAHMAEDWRTRHYGNLRGEVT